MYGNVPKISPSVAEASGLNFSPVVPLATTGPRQRASPKSSSFTPDVVSMMLAGLRSRCTMPLACAAASAPAI